MTETAARTAPLAVTDLGTGGPALLFVPGWCGDRDRVRPAAARRVRSTAAWCPSTCPTTATRRRVDGDFTTGDVVDALVATIDALGIDTVVPVGLSHAGWAAIELRRRLGADRVPGRGADGLDGARHAARLRRRPRRPAVARRGPTSAKASPRCGSTVSTSRP